MKRGKIIENLEVTAYANEGKSIARQNNMVIFIDGAVPGDVADVRITRKKKSWLEGRIEKLVSPSARRTAPFCSHFGICGGCKWQFLDYQTQLTYKQQSVIDLFERIGKVAAQQVLPIKEARQQIYYRNKLDYSAGDRAWMSHEDFLKSNKTNIPALGFHVAGNYTSVLDITECFLQPEPSNLIRSIVKEFAINHGITFFNNFHKNGFLRTLIIRNNSAGEFMVILVVAENRREWLEPLLTEIKNRVPALVSINYIINKKLNDTVFDLEVINWSGAPFLTEQLGDLKFRISPKSFFQTNTMQAVELYNTVLDFCSLNGRQVVYDLYGGTGSIALYVSKHALRVIGVEQVADATADAGINARINGATNVEFITSDMRHSFLSKLFEEKGRPDVIIADPPRAGMHPDVVNALNQSNAERIVYVSCNPATQARDINVLSHRYQLMKIQPVDMFPHTHHIENVALLEKKQM